jgi:D-sedoheptulose 7-phosphate isomerase
MLNPASIVISINPAAAPFSDSLSYFRAYDKVLATMPHQWVEQVADKLFEAYRDGKGIYLFGNGGSAALASHFACDLGKGTSFDGKSQKRFRAISLTDNLPLLTAWANDTSYELVFAEQLRNFVEPSDVVFAISGSGNSPNVLHGLKAARQAGAFTIGLGGFHGGKMKSLCDLCIVIPSDNMQIIEDFHVSVTHALFTLLCSRIRSQAEPRQALVASAK